MLGAVARHLVSEFVQSRAQTGFPVGTLTVNIVGCFLLGLASAWISSRSAIPRALLMAGFLGAFTTFSTFALESLELLERKPLTAILYLATSNLLGIIATLGGRALGLGVGSSP